MVGGEGGGLVVVVDIEPAGVFLLARNRKVAATATAATTIALIK